MATYRFNQNLVFNVLADQTFQRTGAYVGQDGSYYYAVIDPRRHNVNVWTKAHDNEFRPLEPDRYRTAAGAHNTIFCTNGPPMEIPVNTIVLPLAGPIYSGFAHSIRTGEPWDPYDAVRSGNQDLHPGRGNLKWAFERTGQGSLAAYRVAQAKPTGIEGISGYGIVSAGAVVNSPDHAGLKAKRAAAAWCRRPIAPPQNAPWETQVRWLDGVEAMSPLDGVIIAVAINAHPTQLANKIVRVGCTEAVAMDGSTSALCGSGGAMRFECETEKDLVQRWGLYCT